VERCLACEAEGSPPTFYVRLTLSADRDGCGSDEFCYHAFAGGCRNVGHGAYRCRPRKRGSAPKSGGCVTTEEARQRSTGLSFTNH
jgi:hypothetical protein